MPEKGKRDAAVEKIKRYWKNRKGGERSKSGGVG